MTAAGGNSAARVSTILLGILGAPRVIASISTLNIAAAIFAIPLRELIGWAGLVTILTALASFSVLSLIAQRGRIEWRGILPLSLLVFVSWSTLSVFWSHYEAATLQSAAYQLLFTVLALFVALSRDMIQIVRGFGDVLRAALGVSLVVEVISGVLIDTPIAFLRVAGNLGEGGPIQGIVGSRNLLGFLGLVALLTFGTELLTKSVRRGVAIGSIIGASLTIALSQSPGTFATLGVVALAALALLALRRVSSEQRRMLQFGLAASAAVALAIVVGFRTRILGALDASAELDYRVTLWQDVVRFARINNLEGWGWVGRWRPNRSPFYAIDPFAPGRHESALNAFFDIWFQLGLIGLFAFTIFVLLAFVRAWLLAATKRSTVYVWPALVLGALLVTSLAESLALIEFGWFILVVCAVKAAKDLSWRRSLPD